MNSIDREAVQVKQVNKSEVTKDFIDCKELFNLHDYQSRRKYIMQQLPVNMSGDSFKIDAGEYGYIFTNVHPDYFKDKGLLAVMINNLYSTVVARCYVLKSNGIVDIHPGGGLTSDMLKEGNVLIEHEDGRCMCVQAA